jgi:hypothetical protein
MAVGANAKPNWLISFLKEAWSGSQALLMFGDWASRQVPKVMPGPP